MAISVSVTSLSQSEHNIYGVLHKEMNLLNCIIATHFFLKVYTWFFWNVPKNFLHFFYRRISLFQPLLIVLKANINIIIKIFWHLCNQIERIFTGCNMFEVNMLFVSKNKYVGKPINWRYGKIWARNVMGLFTLKCKKKKKSHLKWHVTKKKETNEGGYQS